jgi:origin recognition complex subunit 4
MREIARQVSRQLGAAWGTDTETEDDVGGVPPAAQLMSLASSLPNLPKPVIIVIESFDLFAFHPRQALLYCLFDTVQSLRPGATNSGFAVVGVTNRLDFLNTLEKRVKSRFSHRTIRVSPCADLEAYVTMAENALSCTVENTPDEWKKLWTASVRNFISHRKVQSWFSESFNISREIGNMAKQLVCIS